MAQENPGITLIAAKDLVVRYNDQTVLNKATLSISEGQRIGMVGRNGSGKSTFLKILVGRMNPDAGEVSKRTGLRMGYLSQEFTLDENLNVYDNIKAGAKDVLDLIAEFESLPGDSTRHEELEEKIVRMDGWDIDNRIETVMSHLNTAPATSSIENLSGGELRRIALCRALIAQPELLILDEPTNHLDAESIAWLADFIKNFKGAVLLVTHDRYFLDEATSTIVEMANGETFTFEGNYTDYLISKAERQSAEDNTERKRQSFIRRELDWVRRGPKARTTKSKSRLDRFYEQADKAPPLEELDMELVIPPPPQLGNRVVDLINAGITLGNKHLFSGVDFNFERGMKIGITGRNGLGKTTLVKMIIGALKATEGTVKIGSQVEFNYVDQSRLMVNEERSLLEEVGEGRQEIQFGNGRLTIRAYLKRFLFPDDRLGVKVKVLSGGERSRLMLAKILKNGGNFLILDEPTNDLDLASLRVLEEALSLFPGCVLVVSHDRYFLNRICTGILAFEGSGRVVYSVGDYDYYQEKRAARLAEEKKFLEMAKAAKPAAAKPKPAGKPRKLTWKEKEEFEGMEETILETEEEIARIEELFASPDFHQKHGTRTAEIQAELEANKTKLTQLYERWEHLEKIANGEVMA